MLPEPKRSALAADGLHLALLHCCAGVLEQALGLLVSLLLRNPDACKAAVGCGCVDTVLEAMDAAESERGFADSPVGAQWVLRQVWEIILVSLPALAPSSECPSCAAARTSRS